MFQLIEWLIEVKVEYLTIIKVMFIVMVTHIAFVENIL